ncbi:MAG: hypothetical protein NC124_19500, partial [Clostridium sp.]|nr:hypothetical protein [Clostridium sp.]
MFTQRIRNCIFRIYKSIPFIVLLLLVILPMMVHRSIHAANTPEEELVLQQYYSFFYPACIIYMFIIIFYPYIEGEGKEIFYVYQRMYLGEAFIPFLLLCTILCASVVFYGLDILDNPLLFLIKNIIILFCFSGLCYFLLFALNSITMMTIVSVLFFLITVLNPLELLNVLPYNLKI